MGTMTTEELAKDLGVDTQQVIRFLRERKFVVSPKAKLSREAERLVREHFAQVSNNTNTSTEKEVKIPNVLTVKELSEYIGVPAVEVMTELIKSGVMATINQQIDFDTAAIVAASFNVNVVPINLESAVVVESQGDAQSGTTFAEVEKVLEGQEEDESELQPRAPVVTVLGHVDHGKTTILDAIRKTRVAEQEVGGITQRIGAYVAEYQGRKIVFLDTPGHEAFTAMRARGAKVTDIAVLVVAADDGVMPQTIEAISHARAAGVPILVAINKIDKEGINIDRVHQQLADQGLVVEEWGGDTVCVHVSAKEMVGIDELLEMILLLADLRELKANPNRPAIGTVIDSHLEKGKGPVATVLVQAGTLRVGEFFVCGTTYGKVRSLISDRGAYLKEAGPSTPVVVMGFEEVPQAGEVFQVVSSEKVARDIALKRKEAIKIREEQQARPQFSLEEFLKGRLKGEAKELNLLVKAETQGSLEAVEASIQNVAKQTQEVGINIIHKGVGNITESDVLLAKVAGAILLGYGVKPDSLARKAAEQERVEIRTYEIIYNLIEDIERAVKGLFEPKYKEVYCGIAEVVTPINVPRVGIVAGCRVNEGKVVANGVAVVKRQGKEVVKAKIISIKHFKEDVDSIVAGQECGIRLEGFEQFQPGDILECYQVQEA